MGKHRNYDDEDILYASWTDALQEFISNLVSNFRLVYVNTTTVRAEASSGMGQVSVGFGGPWRYRASNYDLTISGGPGTKTIWAVAVSANDFEGPSEDPDETEYAFELRSTTGAEPGSVALSRKVGEVDWDGTKITAIRQTIESISGANIAPGALSNEGDLSWSQEPNGAWKPDLRSGIVGNTELANGAITDTKVATANKDGSSSVASMRTLGTGAKQAAAGNDSRLSDERTPKPNSVDTAKIKDQAVTDVKMETPVIEGSVAASGEIVAGTGFNVVRTGVGRYTITLSQELSSLGVATGNSCVGAGVWAVGFSPPAKEIFKVEIFALNSLTLVDQPFNFFIKQSN
jgi:hypothetical protein